MTTNTTQRSVLRELRSLNRLHYGGPRSDRMLAELQAKTLLRATGHSDGPVPDAIIAGLPRITVRYAALPTSGISVWDGQRWVITLNSSEPRTRQRFTLLHEYKHIIDHPDCTWLYHDRPQATATEQAEQAADYFAGCVLVPTQQLRRVWRQGLESTRALAQHFNVSVPAIEVRLAQIAIRSPGTRCGAAAATSAEGKVA